MGLRDIFGLAEGDLASHILETNPMIPFRSLDDFGHITAMVGRRTAE
jgi:hypothetical protein